MESKGGMMSRFFNIVAGMAIFLPQLALAQISSLATLSAPETYYEGRTAADSFSSPYSRYFTIDDINRFERNQHRRQRHIAKGHLIVVDTRDQDTCLAIQHQLLNARDLQTLNDPRDLCLRDDTRPFASITVLRASDEDEWHQEMDLRNLTSDQSNLYTSTRNMALGAAGVAGLLYMMPESVTKWNKDKMKKLGKNYQENIRNGPVMDQDNWALNYLGHPYSGAIYYQVARHNDLSTMESFGYSVLMSTFFWEYGIEALAETPSIQDLLITPIIGSIMGEVFYIAEREIQLNNGKVWGSKKLGSIVLILLNPVEAFSKNLNNLLGSTVIKNARASIVVRRQKVRSKDLPMEYTPFWGLELRFKF
ncbi:DUF3943 domain-containing protein [Bdellovibrio bacteriovorus]|nr:DUF3943 domain-containing protein [Bdellovibrio bacteriovorus]